MEKLESIDHDNFQDIYDDLKFLAGKRANAEEQVGERSEEFLDVRLAIVKFTCFTAHINGFPGIVIRTF